MNEFIKKLLGADNIIRRYRLEVAGQIVFLLSLWMLLPQATAVSSDSLSNTGIGWQYEYNAIGRVSSIIDPANRRTKIRYTLNKRGGIHDITKELPSGSKSKFKFDSYERRTEMVDDVGTVGYAYDTFGRLLKVHREGTPAITYSYDTLGRIKSMSIGSQFTVRYVYDFRGRMEKVITPVGNIRYTYNSKTDEVTRRLPNGVSTRWVNRPDGRLESISHTSSGDKSLAQYQYTYRLDGLISSIQEVTPSGVQTYSYRYDTTQRLVSTSRGSQVRIEYGYDQFGNRIRLHRQGQNPVEAQYDWAGRLIGYNGQACQHDPVGNLTSCIGSSKSFSFYDTGLLKTVVLKNGSIRYQYDGDGYLISRSNGAVKQTFLSDPASDFWQPLMVRRANGRQTYYVWDGTSPLMAVTGDQVYYFLQDHIGSVRLVTDQRGDILERRDYTPFGQAQQEPAGEDFQPGFAGLFFDKPASVYLTQARAYDPELACFLQPDPEHRVPMGSQKDLSVYAYCGGDPINFVDRNGASPASIMPNTNPIRNVSEELFSWHYDRNEQNIFPDGKLTAQGNATRIFQYTPGGNNNYKDASDRIWTLVSDDMSRYHQEVTPPSWLAQKIYPGITNPWTKTYKFVSKNKDGSSYEAILVSGQNAQDFYSKAYWMNSGPKQPTYNYSNPTENPFSSASLKHFAKDMVTHDILPGGSQYKSTIRGGERLWYGTKQSRKASNILRRQENELTSARLKQIAGYNMDSAKTRAHAALDMSLGSFYNTGMSASYGAFENTSNQLVNAYRSGQSLRPLASTHLSAYESATRNTLSSFLGAVEAAGKSLQYIGESWFAVAGETGLQHRTSRGYYGYKHQSRNNYDYTRMGTLDVTSQGMQRLDYTKISGPLSGGRFEYSRGITHHAKSLGWLGNIMQRRFPLKGYDPSDTIRTVTRYQSTQRETFNGAAFNRAYAEYEKTGGYRGPMENHFSGFNESKVGGIRLAGASNALSYLGVLAGIALDETNGRLILIGKRESPINLPPLRLDDVVVIFRSVYLHGEAPSVSIDPISDKKTERWMTVQHGPANATLDSYVAWILYSCDRIMKCYGIGEDNKTRRKVYSRVPGYKDFNAIGLRSWKPQWERFWIVPASQTRKQGSTSELTMFDIPLKLETEKMEWNGSKLVTAKNPTPSQSAAEYTNWFTSRYDAIAKEVRLTPPPCFGIRHPVLIFEELRRMALITGIAEILRDQNVPFPAWMYDYPVRPCISDRKTPVLRVKGNGYEVSGGIQLAAMDNRVKTTKGDLPISQLSNTIHEMSATTPLFAPTSFQQQGKTYEAVSLPGSDTLRSGANVLQHADVVLPVLQNAGISLTRHFNSFYDPNGLFGWGWTLDLPRLRTQKQPVTRTETSTRYKIVYQLTSPLNSWSARFADVKVIPELTRQLIVPGKPGQMLGLVDSTLPVTGQGTKELIFREGGSWHFDKKGYLLAVLDERRVVIYHRDAGHKITSIVSRTLQSNPKAGSTPKAEVHLTYREGDRRVSSIEVRSPELEKFARVHYIYSEAGQLTMVIGSSGKTEYTYRDGLVTSITRNNEKMISFKYNEQGQLREEGDADGNKVAYRRTNTYYGTKVEAFDPESEQPLETIEYDGNFQPRCRRFGDGSHIVWKREKKELKTIVTDSEGEGYTLTESSDGRHSTLKSTTGETYTTDFDAAGRVTRAHIEGGPTLEQTWHADGRLKKAISDEQGILPSYTRDGTLSSFKVTPPDQARTEKPLQYVKTDYDAEGRITSVKDDSGSQLQIGYDHSGQPSVIRSPRGSVMIDYDANGQVSEVDTTWGFVETYDYSEATNSLTRITQKRQHAETFTEHASIELTDGRISNIRQPDGGETTFDYFQNGYQKDLLKNVRTSEELTLAYNYDNSTRLTGIDLSSGYGPVYRINYKYDQRGRLTGILYKPTSDLKRVMDR